MHKIISEITQERIKQGLSETQLSALAGVDQKNVNNLLSGRTKRPDYETITALRAALGLQKDECQTVDIFNMVDGGSGTEPEWHEPIDTRVIPSVYLKPGVRPVLVRGRSMEPTFKNGAIIGVSENEKQVVDGEAYAVVLPYAGAAIKRLYVLPDGVLIRSDNKEFPEVSLKRADIPDYFILGRVCWVIQEV